MHDGVGRAPASRQPGGGGAGTAEAAKEEFSPGAASKCDPMFPSCAWCSAHAATSEDQFSCRRACSWVKRWGGASSILARKRPVLKV